MTQYRLYRMDPFSGHIDGVEEFHSGDDAEAIRLVRERSRAVPLELWQGGRKLVHIDAQRKTAPRIPIPERRRGEALLSA